MSVLNFSDLYGGRLGSPNFPILKIFKASEAHIFTHPGTIFLRGVGAGAGGFYSSDGSPRLLASGAAAGWGQVVKKVAAGDVMTCSIGAGGNAGRIYSTIKNSGANGGDTVIELHGEVYVAAGGAGVEVITTTSPATFQAKPAKQSSGPWDFAVDGRTLSNPEIQGFLTRLPGTQLLSYEKPTGWGVDLREPFGGWPFMGGSNPATSSSAGGPGGVGAGGGKPGDANNSEAGGGGNGVVIMYFWPDTNP